MAFPFWAKLGILAEIWLSISRESEILSYPKNLEVRCFLDFGQKFWHFFSSFTSSQCGPGQEATEGQALERLLPPRKST